MEYRGYNIFRDKVYANYHIQTIGRGSLPLTLDGIFTKDTYAKHAIDRYLDEKGVESAPSIEQVAKKALKE
jgi:hypothetical protein